LNSIVFEGVSQTYTKPGGGNVIALDGVSATFEPGAVSALVGRSGSGKTTLIRLAAGLEVPSEGSVRIGECRVERLSSGDRLKLRRDTVSVIFQDQAMVPEMTVAENLRLALQVSGRRGDKSLIDERLTEVGLAGYERRFVGTLSGGEEQRAAIARALVLNHPVLLADEPTGSLDAENALLVVEALKNVARRGVAVLVATHDDVVYSRCDALLRIDQGALVAA